MNESKSTRSVTRNPAYVCLLPLVELSKLVLQFSL